VRVRSRPHSLLLLASRGPRSHHTHTVYITASGLPNAMEVPFIRWLDPVASDARRDVGLCRAKSAAGWASTSVGSPEAGEGESGAQWQ
jgi:hypothetical protein